MQRKNVSQVELRLTIQTMLDVVFRMSGYIYDIFFSVDANDTVYGSIIVCTLLSAVNSLNPYIYLTFNK